MSTKIKRAESFLGIHFDFHAREDYTDIGKNTTPEMIEKIIDMVKPDYIQCDCKGHPGFSSYPTKTGNAAPGLAKDGLRVWREVTEKHGVALFMHYSGVWDTEALRQHPAWARIDENSERDKNYTSIFGPYVDELLIPQLIELREEYRIDGVWLVISLGGGFQAYFQQKNDGSISEWQMKLMNEVAEFCRQRQQFCHKVTAVPQIALLYSSFCYYKGNTRLFGPWDGIVDHLKGVLQCLLDSQNAVEILTEQHLKGKMSEYPLIIIPEWKYIQSPFKDELIEYVNAGGKLGTLRTHH